MSRTVTHDKSHKLFMQSIPWTLLDGAVGLVYALGMFVLLGRFLSARDFGLAGIALAVTQLVEATYITGMQEAVVRAPSGHTALSDTAHSLTMGFSCIAVVACGLIGWGLAWSYGQSSIFGLVLLASLSLPINALFAVPAARLSRKIRTKILTSRMVLAKIFAAPAFIVTAMAGLGPWSVIGSTLASSLGSCLLIYWRTRRRPKFRFDLGEARGLLRFGLVSSAGNFLWLVSGRVFALLFGYFHGVEALGFFQFAQRLVDELAALLQVTIIRVGLPYFSALNRKGHDIAGVFLLGTRLLNSVAVPVYAGLMLIAPMLIPLIFGHRWDAAIPMVWVLAFAWIVVFGKILLPVLVKAQGVPVYNLTLTIVLAVSALVAVLATALLSPLAAVMGWGLAQSANMPLQLWIIRKQLGVPILMQIRQMIPAFLATAAMTALVLSMQKLLVDFSPLTCIIVSVAVGVVSYAFFIVMLDRRLAEILVNMMRGKKNLPHSS